MQILRHFFIIFNVFIFNKLRIQWCNEAIHTHESQLSDFQEFYEPGEVTLVTRTPPWWEYLVVQTPQVKGSVHKMPPPHFRCQSEALGHPYFWLFGYEPPPGLVICYNVSQNIRETLYLLLQVYHQGYFKGSKWMSRWRGTWNEVQKGPKHRASIPVESGCLMLPACGYVHNQTGRMIDKIFPIGGGTENSSSLKTVVSSGVGDGRWRVAGNQTLPSSSLGTHEDSAH